MFEPVYFCIKQTAMQQQHLLFTMGETSKHYKILMVLLYIYIYIYIYTYT